MASQGNGVRDHAVDSRLQPRGNLGEAIRQSSNGFMGNLTLRVRHVVSVESDVTCSIP